MKKAVSIFSLSVVFVMVLMSLVSCSKAADENESKTTTSPQTTASSVYYDKNGAAYDSKEGVKYYDKSGNVYHYMMVEDYLPDYVEEKSGEHINGFECYIDENGYFCHIADNSLSRVENTVDTYEDAQGNKYYDISTVSWDENGNMLHNNFVTGK